MNTYITIWIFVYLFTYFCIFIYFDYLSTSTILNKMNYSNKNNKLQYMKR